LGLPKARRPNKYGRLQKAYRKPGITFHRYAKMQAFSLLITTTISSSLHLKGKQKSPYELIMRETDADLMKFEMDLFWVNMANEDPVAWFDRNQGRIPLWHVKDMVKEEDKYMVNGNEMFFAPVGEGKSTSKEFLRQEIHAE
jgi:hypothetical protein